jgi:CotS family spore coat protein
MRPEQLLEKYQLTVKSISKGRECYLCDTSQGTVALHEYYGSIERAAFLAGMLAHLKQDGLLVEGIIASTEGEWLITDEEERRFLLSECFSGAECDVKKEEDMYQAVKTLARLHKSSKNYTEEIPELIRRNLTTLAEAFEKHNRELRQIKNYIRGRKKKNTFEALFMKEYDNFYKRAEDVTAALSCKNLSEESYGFCHGDFNQHSIVFAKQGIAIVGLERFTYDLQVRDLANFIRKMMEKNERNAELGIKLIATYEKEYSLSQQEKECLYLFLAYPDKFWKVATHYNHANKSWLCERDVEKLEKLILQEEKRDKFLQELLCYANK